MSEANKADKLLKKYATPKLSGKMPGHYNLIQKAKRVPQAERQKIMSDLRTAILLEGMRPRLPQDFN